MPNRTIAQVVLDIRQHANAVNRQVVTDAEVLARANEGLWSLYDLIDGAHGTYFVVPHDFTLVGGYGANTAPLPSDFYRAKALDYSPDTSAMCSVDALPSFAERNNPSRRMYDLEDVSNIVLLPPTRAAGAYRLRYIPKCPQLAFPIVVSAVGPPAPSPISPIPLPRVSTAPVVLTSQLLGTQGTNARDLLVQVKNAWKAAGWVVVQSYSGRFGGLPAPGVDAWVDYTDLVGVSGGGIGDSWIVLANPGFGPAQICIEITVGGTLAWAECGLILAPAGGFTGGLPSARPTAPNEITTNSQQWCGTNPNGNPQFYATTWVAPDGSYLRTAWWYGGKCISWWQIDLIQFAANWPTPNVLIFWKGGNDYTAPGNRMNIFQFTLIDSSSGTFKRSHIPAGVIAWQGVDEAQQPGGTNYTAAIHAGVNDWTNQYPWFSPIGLDASGRSAGSNGFAGYLIDQWWTVPAFNDGDTMGDSFNFIIIQQMVLQWNGTVPSLGSASTNYPTAKWYGRSAR